MDKMAVWKTIPKSARIYTPGRGEDGVEVMTKELVDLPCLACNRDFGILSSHWWMGGFLIH